MTRIKYVDNNKDRKLDVGDFVSVNSSEGYSKTDFAIVASRGAYWTVVDLHEGTDYGRWVGINTMTDVLCLRRITKPFTIYPESEDDDD